MLHIFVSHGEQYTFNMNRWKKTKENTKKAITSFNAFAQLMLEIFGDTSDQLEQVKFDGLETIISTKQDQIVNILKYACVEVFTCAEEIIVSHRRSLLD